MDNIETKAGIATPCAIPPRWQDADKHGLDSPDLDDARTGPPVAPNPATAHPAEEFLSALDPNATAFTFQTFNDNEERKSKRLKDGRDPFVRVLHASWKVQRLNCKH